MHLHYPGLSKIWLENARRAQRGLPPLPVPLVMTPAAIRMRELRALRRRRAEYEHLNGGAGGQSTGAGVGSPIQRPRVSP